MPLAVSLRKIVTGKRLTPCENHTRNATHPLTHGFTVAASLHRATVAGPRERGHWAITANDTSTARDTGTGSWRRGCTKMQARHYSCRASARHGQHEGVFAQVATGRTGRWGARALRGAGGAGRALARASADTRHSLRRNDEAAGYARALCVAASRIFPTACELSRSRVNKPATLLLLTQWWG